MEILVYSINYAPELTGVAKYNSEMCEWLVRRGHKLTVITAKPYYPEWKIYGGYGKYWFDKETINGVDVIRCPLYVPGNPTGLKRIIHLASFAIISLIPLIQLLLKKPNIIFFVEPTFFTFPAAILFSKLMSVKSVLHIQDFEVDAGIALIFKQYPRLVRAVMRFERWCYCNVDRVSTISGKMMEKLQNEKAPTSECFLFPNWVDVGEIYPLEQESRYREEWGIPESSHIALYSGNLGEKQGLEILIDLAQQMSGTSWVFVICGSGAAEKRLKTMGAEATNIIWLPLQPFESLNELLNSADVHLLPQRVDAEDLVMPSKLTGIFASGKPVLATANTGTEIYDVLENRGMVVPPGDVEGMKAVLLEYESSEQPFALFADAGRKYAVEELSVDAILDDFEERLIELGAC